MSVIETRDLTKRYGSPSGARLSRLPGAAGQRFTPPTLAVDSISFAVEQGQVYGFLGPNGSGKTTTIGMLLGIIRPTGGSFRLFGGSSAAEIHAARQRIGATLEYPNFYPYLSGRDNLRLVANVKGKGIARVEEVLAIVGLTNRQKSRFKTYSLGMKQRLALAATMIGDPDLIILDEPANGLDPEGMREIRSVIRNLADMGKTIFLSSHLLWEVERTCSHVAILKHGRIVQQASVQEVTSGTLAGLRGGPIETLRRIVEAYPAAESAVIREDRVVAELSDDDLAALNRFVADRGIHLSHLALEQRSLEEAFFEATRGADVSEPSMGEIS